MRFWVSAVLLTAVLVGCGSHTDESANLPLGSCCSNSAQCASNYCVLGFCTEPCTYYVANGQTGGMSSAGGSMGSAGMGGCGGASSH